MDPFIGEIRLLPYKFVPQGWLPCNGQLISINQVFTQLFAVCGTTYGGDGKSTFMLPNLNGSVPQGAGQGTGLAEVVLGKQYGADQVILGPVNYPPHTHALVARDGTEATQAVDVPSSAVFLAQPRAVYMYAPTTTQQTLATDTLSLNGKGSGAISRSTMQPYLAMCYCICYEGVFPSKT